MNWILFVLVWIQIGELYRVAANFNYPNSDKRKVCSHQKHTVDLRLPICVPTEDGGWEKSSEENCFVKLKSQCPEFNEAECIWQPLTFDQSTVGRDFSYGINLQFPACRLKYKASLDGSLSKKTWMEICYVNQYGTTAYANTDYYIVEIHRMVDSKANGIYGNVTQGDYPFSVPDSKEPGGYTWTDKYLLLPHDKSFNSPICQDGKDIKDFCRSVLRQEYVSNFASTPQVIATCSKTLTLNRVTNELKKEDVCKFEEKTTRDGVTANDRTCEVRTSGNDPSTHKMVMKCRTGYKNSG